MCVSAAAALSMQYWDAARECATCVVDVAVDHHHIIIKHPTSPSQIRCGF